jgi:hypothetical protein
MRLGKIVKSNSHIDYICQIYNQADIPIPPTIEDYAFGTFVAMPLNNHRRLIGIIYDTVLFNPEFGRIGPRLSPETDLAIFSPDYLSEKAVLTGILTIGMFETNGHVIQGIPRIAATTNTEVETIIEEEIRQFHLRDQLINLSYAPILLNHSSSLAPQLLQKIVKTLADSIFPDQSRLLNVLLSDLTWKSQIMPMGGVR